MDNDRMPEAPASNSHAEAAFAEVREAIGHLRSSLDRLEAALVAPARPVFAVAAPIIETEPDDFEAEARPESESDAASRFESTWTPPPALPEAAARADEPSVVEAPAASATPQTPTPPAAREVSWPSWSSGSPFSEPAAWPYPPSANAAASPSKGASDPAASSQEPPVDQDARDQVRRAVERMRAELSESAEVAPAAPESSSVGAAEEEDAREQVRRAVDETRSEPTPANTWASLPGAPAEEAEVLTGEDSATIEDEAPVDVREQVRRAVEAAKAELATDETGPTEAERIAEAFDAEKLRIPHHELVPNERFLQPAILVIDDPEGRVELVRVYRTLARLEVAATANLANYSSHSVTVQLEERKVPGQDEIADAITYAFERECSIDIDGNRASVRLSNGKTRAA